MSPDKKLAKILSESKKNPEDPNLHYQAAKLLTASGEKNIVYTLVAYDQSKIKKSNPFTIGSFYSEEEAAKFAVKRFSHDIEKLCQDVFSYDRYDFDDESCWENATATLSYIKNGNYVKSLKHYRYMIHGIINNNYEDDFDVCLYIIIQKTMVR